MAREPSTKIELTERDLCRWALVEDFRQRLSEAASKQTLADSWSDPQRLLDYSSYLSLFLLGLLNPVVRTMRGLCAASRLQRVQQEVCRRPVSLGSFSEAQAMLEPALLAQVFSQLSQEVRPAPEWGDGGRRWLVQDGSLFEALPRMYWCFWRRQGKPQSQVRLHLSLDLESKCPVRVAITPGKGCERAAWRKQFQRGDAYLGDCYYGEDYQLFSELAAAEGVFVVRLRDEAVVRVHRELALTEADRRAKVIRDAWVKLGGKGYRLDMPVRVVWVQTPKEVLMLVTNLSPAELSAAEVALLYKERWQIELFFRWVKCILGCRHWLAESSEGVAIQIYLALIAALLLQLHTGGAPNKRMMELIQFYLLGVASLEELCAGVKRERARAQKKS